MHRRPRHFRRAARGTDHAAADQPRRRASDQLRARLAGRRRRYEHVRARQRAHLHQRSGHRADQVHVQHRVRRGLEQDRRARRGRAVRDVAEVQRLDGTVPAAQRSRQPLRPVLRASLGGLHRRHPERPSLRLPGARQRRHVLGRFQQGEGFGGHLRRQVRDRRSRGALRGARPGGLLGQGNRLLPQRHLLRRQEPARRGSRNPGAGRRHRDDR